MRALTKLVIGLGVVSLSGQTASAKYWPGPAAAPLRYRFKQGETLRYVFQTKTAVNARLAGANMKLDMRMEHTVDVSMKVAEIKDGMARVVFRFERVRALIDGQPTGKAEFDSKDGRDPPAALTQVLGANAKKLAGLEFRAAIDEQGRVRGLKTPDWLTNAQANGPGTSFSGQNIQLMLDQGFLVLPGEAVVRGKTWNQQLASKSEMGVFEVNNVFTHEGLESHLGGKVARIRTTSTVAFKGIDKMPVKIKSQKASAEGTAYFDNFTGRLVENAWTMRLDLTVDVPGQDIAMDVTQSLSVKLR